MMRIIDRFSDEAFATIVADSTSISQVLTALGYVVAQGSRQLVLERIKKNNLNISHFHDIPSPATKVKKTSEEIFCKNSKVCQSTLRKVYKKEKITPYECSICGLLPVWNGRELTLTLDHIDGDNRNNELSNIRWVCPNCDRQLPTFGSKNKRIFAHPERDPQKASLSQKFCIDCGKRINSGSTRCFDCQNKRLRPERETILWPDDTVLSWMVNHFSLLSIGKALGVSDNAVKKRCRHHGIEIKKGKKLQYSGEAYPIDLAG